MPKIIAINYSDDNFRKQQKYNTKTAYKKGKVDKVIEYTPNDIDLEFRNRNKKILEESRGAGYWLWKPYIINETLKKVNYGDYVFYCDSGAYYKNSVRLLINQMEKNNDDIMLFELNTIEEKWTKPSLFKMMQCNEQMYHNTNQILATYILVKKTDESLKLMRQYLSNCEEYEKISDDNPQKEEYSIFIDHRHDQSILSLLSKKNNIKPYRDPSQFGLLSNQSEGISRKYNENNYPIIIISYRRQNRIKYSLKLFIYRFISKLLMKFK